MNKIISLISFIVLSFQLTAQVDDCSYTQFYKDSTYLTIGENAIIRLNPDTAGRVVYQTTIGDKVRVKEDTKISYTRNGLTANWYRVIYNNKGVKTEGYIWGGHLATKVLRSSTDNEIVFLYNISKVIKQEYFDEVYIYVRVLKDNLELQKLEVQTVGGLRTPNIAESLGNKGVDGVKDILKINFNDGYCAGSFGDIYLFWDGKILHHAITLTEGFDAPYYATSKLIFPADKKGKKGYIINKSENGYSGDDNKNHVEDWEKITYKWDGSKLVAIKTQRK